MSFYLPQTCQTIFWVILGILVFASVFAHVIALRNQEKDYTELKLRIKSWWWMIGFLFGALSFGKTTAILFFMLLSYLAFKELMSIVPTRQCDRRVMFWAYVAIPVQYYWIYAGWYGMFIIFIPIYLFLFIPVRLVLLAQVQGFIKSAGIIQWGIMLTVFGLSHLAYLLNLQSAVYESHPIGYVLFLLVLTQLNDVSQYVWGKSFGRRKIMPKVSPNKTWEGFLGGLGTICVVAYFLGPYLTPLDGIESLYAGMIISVAGFFGDVVLSSVKRDLQIKDTGHLIPGHGGILDRIDSLMYTAPIFFHYLYYMKF